MASPVGHILAAYSAMIAIRPEVVTNPRSHRIAAGTAFIFGNLADTDFAVAYFSQHPALQHHYFSHSIPFAILFAIIAFLMLWIVKFPQPLKTGSLLGLVYSTHLLLDYFTDDGSKPFGIPLLWPFSNHHFLSPWMIFYATHRGGWHDLISRHNAMAILIEVAVLTPVLVLISYAARRNRQNSKH